MVILKIGLYILIAITAALFVKSIVNIVKILKEGDSNGRNEEGF